MPNSTYDDENVRTIWSALNSFLLYRRAAHFNVTHLRRQSFYSLRRDHWQLLAQPPFNLQATFNAVDAAIDANAKIADAIAYTAMQHGGLVSDYGLTLEDWKKLKDVPTPLSLSKARTTIRQLYRDWSAEGAVERSLGINLIMENLAKYFPLPIHERHKINVLVPGAGLGRLVFEIALAGYTVEGNEISYHQLLASSLILNHTTEAGQFALFPWVLDFNNHFHRENQFQCVRIPDVHPGQEIQAASKDHGVPVSERMGMSAADFSMVYRQASMKHKFDAITTLFFIDTAPNFLTYVEAAVNCLKPSGIWINIGPLLWHFDGSEGNKSHGVQSSSAFGHHHHDKHPPAPVSNVSDNYEESIPGSPQLCTLGSNKVREKSVTNESIIGEISTVNEQSFNELGTIELSGDEVLRILEHFGFKIELQERVSTAFGYIQDPRSMLQNLYFPAFWIARKV